MNTNDFDYYLPEEQIAKYPLKNREDSRLLVLNKDIGDFNDRQIKNIIEYIKPNDLLIFNNSKVMLARLYGKKITGAKLEFLVERVVSDSTFYTHVKANKAPKINTEILIDNHKAIVLEKDKGVYLLKLCGDISIYTIMQECGHIPLPPYMKRDDEKLDEKRYQTVYAKHLGSVAAPTAGLHFSNELLAQIKNKGADVDYITLHVGAGTFQPVQVDDVKSHKMHSEIISVSSEICDKIVATKSKGGRVIAVGTTSVRSLESAAKNGSIDPFYGDTDIFLYPGKKFNVVDAMLTNFHLPKSTLIMLVSAFVGKENVMNAYKHAIENNYRFYSYGDAMFIF